MIWVIAGTTEGKKIINELLKSNKKIIATTATEYGKQLISKNKNLEIISKKLDEKKMGKFIKNKNIKLIIDASHPFSIEVSKNAMIVSKNHNIPYLRYERKKIEFKNVLKFDSYGDVIKFLSKKKGNVFLTIGTNNIKYFSKLNANRIFMRILPVSESIQICESMGFLTDNIIAMKGKFSKELNKSIFKEFNIKFLVTKDSGIQGGLKEKIQGALELGIIVLLINRPEMKYPEIFHVSKSLLKRIKDLKNE